MKEPLVVDDEPIVRESLKDWPEDAGYEVMTTETSEEALEIVEKYDIGAAIPWLQAPWSHGNRNAPANAPYYIHCLPGA